MSFGNISKTKYSFRVSDLNAGVYIITVYDQFGNAQNSKFIKQ
jgi:hypothetical protein